MHGKNMALARAAMAVSGVLLLFALLLAAAPARADMGGSISAKRLVNIIKKESRDKVLVLNFWATWCGPCRKEIPELVEIRKEYSRDDVMILGVSVDNDPKVLPPFISKMKINYPVYRAEPDVAGTFRVSAVPTFMIFNSQGLVVNQAGMVPAPMLRAVLNRLVQGNNAAEGK